MTRCPCCSARAMKLAKRTVRLASRPQRPETTKSFWSIDRGLAFGPSVSGACSPPSALLVALGMVKLLTLSEVHLPGKMSNVQRRSKAIAWLLNRRWPQEVDYG